MHVLTGHWSIAVFQGSALAYNLYQVRFGVYFYFFRLFYTLCVNLDVFFTHIQHSKCILCSIVLVVMS